MFYSVGDKVRVTYGHGWDGEGEVIMSSPVPVVRMRTGEMAGTDGGFPEENLELLPPVFSALDPRFRKFAIREWSEVVPGRRYAIVHTMETRRSERRWATSRYADYSPFVQYVWVTGRGQGHEVFPQWGGNAPIFWYAEDRKPYDWQSPLTVNLSHRYAADSGIWGVGGYKNESNYMLDVADILKYTGFTLTD